MQHFTNLTTGEVYEGENIIAREATIMKASIIFTSSTGKKYTKKFHCPVDFFIGKVALGSRVVLLNNSTLTMGVFLGILSSGRNFYVTLKDLRQPQTKISILSHRIWGYYTLKKEDL